MSELLLCPFCGGEAQTYCVDTWWVSHACDCLGKYIGTKEHQTEAEAIAAWNTRVDYHGYEKAAIEAWESIKAWNTRVAHGTLTAEQVREAIKANAYPETSTTFEFGSSSWQEIADELNSRAERTCEWELEHSGTLYDKWRCLKCGYLFVEPRCDQGYTDLEPNYCPNCGRKVVGE